jgi:hypothetical protein
MSSFPTPMEIDPPDSKRILELEVEVAVYKASATTQEAYNEELAGKLEDLQERFDEQQEELYKKADRLAYIDPDDDDATFASQHHEDDYEDEDEEEAKRQQYEFDKAVAEKVEQFREGYAEAKKRAAKWEGMAKTEKEGRIHWQNIAQELQQEKADTLAAARKEKNKNNKQSARAPKAKESVQSGGITKVKNKKLAHHARRKHNVEASGLLYALPRWEKPVQQEATTEAEAEDAIDVSGA